MPSSSPPKAFFEWLWLCRIERRPPKLDLTLYPYLPRVAVAITSPKAYLMLLGGAHP